MSHWHTHRFTPNTTKIVCQCLACGRFMWLPPVRAAEYSCCSAECGLLWRNRNKKARVRECETCGKTFSAQLGQIKAGQGRFCSRACNTVVAFHSPESLRKSQETMARMRAAGLVAYKRGEGHHCWKGGVAAMKQREREDGRTTIWRQNWRRKNPEKRRENENRRKTGRLPKGTIERIGHAQRWRCAICRANIKTAYEIDHVRALAKGGDHRPSNLQLLCRPCNRRKSAKDPIDYMQSLGRLL